MTGTLLRMRMEKRCGRAATDHQEEPGGLWRLFPGNNHHIRLKSCYGKYLTASEEPFLLGMAGRKVIQDTPESVNDAAVDWEPRTEGFLVKLKTRRGKFLRANGRMPPWNNSVTHGHRA
ncbi:hypothetical protein OIU84_029007 [Salix udensis]|uniref:DUF569 domain-containing protein n=1 Tax=Salix udensis TaxID=889485 RepID=A0AAD6KDY6_9ROSI|nr:hypothetical protein OIU84_029007 [Salix udensis]